MSEREINIEKNERIRSNVNGTGRVANTRNINERWSHNDRILLFYTCDSALLSQAVNE